MTEPNFDHIHLITCVGVDTELAHLPHFIDHYRELGVQPVNFHVVLNTPDPESPGLASARRLLAEHGLAEHEAWLAPYTSDTMWAKRREVQAQVTAADDWVVSADVDEFHEYPVSLPTLLADCERHGVNCLQGVFIDRLAPMGALAPVAGRPSIKAQFPLQADVQCAIAGTGEHYNFHGTVKMMAFRGNIWPGKGGHLALPGEVAVSYLFGRNLGGFPDIGKARFRFFVPLRVHHFKWTETMPATLRRRLATPGLSLAGGEYTRALLDYFDRHGNSVALADVPLRRGTRIESRSWRARAITLRTIDAMLWYRSRLGGLGRKLLAKRTS